MAGYYIGEIEVHDHEAYAVYREKAATAIAACGGTYLVRGGATTPLEGEEPAGRIVILRFDNVEAVKAWFHSDVYAEAHAIRERAATSRTFAIEGEDLPPLIAGEGPAAYYIGERIVHDADAYADYAKQAAPILEQFGGAYMIKGTTPEPLEGDAPMPRVIVLRYPSVERCLSFFNSNEYHPVHDIRAASATSRTFVAEGVAD